MTASQLYGPYGSVRYQNGTPPTDYGFTHQRADATSGLDYYNARYYDPVAGQFTSADTARDGLNRYAYVHDNPETHTDPTGHCVPLCTMVAGLIVGAIIGVAVGINNHENAQAIFVDAMIGAGTGAIVGATLGAGLAAAGVGVAGEGAAAVAGVGGVGGVALADDGATATTESAPSAEGALGANAAKLDLKQEATQLQNDYVEQYKVKFGAAGRPSSTVAIAQDAAGNKFASINNYALNPRPALDGSDETPFTLFKGLAERRGYEVANDGYIPGLSANSAPHAENIMAGHLGFGGAYDIETSWSGVVNGEPSSFCAMCQRNAVPLLLGKLGRLYTME
ncbi:MAG TPA: RHS repeat-associated core domain-containing protein [Ktedonobacterales bacterium]